MKKLLFVFLTSLMCSHSLYGQVVFCPAGAQWNFSFVNIPAWNGAYYYANEQITYTGDSISGTDTLKILSHHYYYSTCYNVGGASAKNTLIRQKGDTIFFKNAKTQNNWEILINFAATAGNGWQTNVLKANNTVATYTYVVDSVRTITVNGFNLRKLYCGASQFTERFGNSHFLFDYISYSAGCDGYYVADFLCYKDSNFGTRQFTPKSCYFSGLVVVEGIDERPSDALFLTSNPFHDIISLKTNRNFNNVSIVVQDIFGKQIMVADFKKSPEMTMDLSSFPVGLYFLRVFDEGKLIENKKLIKE